MLILSRKAGESIRIGDSIEVTVIRLYGNRVKLGIQAPEGIKILRTELSLEQTSAVSSRQSKDATSASNSAA